MKEIVVIGGVRTPIGSHGGSLRDIPPQELARIVMTEVMKRTGTRRREIHPTSRHVQALRL